MVLIVLRDRTPEGSPVLNDDEEVFYTAPDVTLVFGSADPEGVGAMFVTNERVIWLQASSDRGFALDFPSIGMHAIAKDSESFDKPCLLVQTMTEDEGGDDGEEEEDAAVAADPSLATQLRFIPADATLLEDMFTAFSDGAALHPDDDDGEEDGEGFFGDFGGNGDVSLFVAGEHIEPSIDHADPGQGEEYEARRAQVLAYLDSVLVEPEGEHVEEGQFDDADEGDDESKK